MATPEARKPPEGLLEDAESRILAGGLDKREGRGAVDFAKRLLVDAQGWDESESKWSSTSTGEQGKLLTFRKRGPQPTREYTVSLNPDDGGIREVRVREAVADAQFTEPFDRLDVIGGRTGRIERFDDSGNLREITVNAFDEHGRGVEIRREARLDNGGKLVEMWRNEYTGVGTGELSRERISQITFRPDGTTQRSYAQERDREGVCSFTNEDYDQGYRQIYYRGPPGVGFNRTERLSGVSQP